MKGAIGFCVRKLNESRFPKTFPLYRKIVSFAFSTNDWTYLLAYLTFDSPLQSTIYQSNNSRHRNGVTLNLSMADIIQTGTGTILISVRSVQSFIIAHARAPAQAAVTQ